MLDTFLNLNWGYQFIYIECLLLLIGLILFYLSAIITRAITTSFLISKYSFIRSWTNGFKGKNRSDTPPSERS